VNVEALPEAAEQAAGAGEQQLNAEAPAEIKDEAQQTEGEGEQGEKKPERHPLEKELAKERRRIARLVEQREQARAEAAMLRQQTQQPNSLQSDQSGDTLTSDERVTLTPAELKKLIQQEAQRLAPEVSSKQAQEVELRGKALGLQKALGDEFQTVTEDLAAILPSGDLQLAVLSADAPAELARYLTDPDNADEAERIGRMSPVQAGRAFARIEAKLEAIKANSTPQPSRAAAPLEAVRGGGITARDLNTIANDQAWYLARQKARQGK
jgi:hypothetical protein